MEEIKKDTIFALVTSSSYSDGQLRSTRFFKTKSSAATALRKIANDRRNKLGVTVTTDTEMKFSFIMGWEGLGATFSIVELPIEE